MFKSLLARMSGRSEAPGPVGAIFPGVGAAGFAVFGELSMRQPRQFLWWSAASALWLLVVFGIMVRPRPRGRLLLAAAPALVMIAASSAMSLLFYEAGPWSRALVVFFAMFAYLLLEHIRHDASEGGRPRTSEVARMANIGSVFIFASTGLGITIFLPVSFIWTVAALAVFAASSAMHLAALGESDREGRWSRAVLAAVVVVETYLVALRLPTTMFVGGAMVGIVYYLAADLLSIGRAGPPPPKLVRRYFIFGLLLILILLATARWVE